MTNADVQVKDENGPVIAKVSITSEAPGANKLERIITLTAGSDEVALENIV
jgi:hypothetical protein